MRVTVWDSLEECEGVVRPLLDSEGTNPFLGFDWLKLHWRHFGSQRGRELLLVGVWRNGGLVTFAPLWHRRRFAGLREIGLVGEGLSDYLGFAGEASTCTLQAVVRTITGRWPDALFRFHDISRDTDLSRALDSATAFACHRKATLYPCTHRDLDALDGHRFSPGQKKHERRVRNSLLRLRIIGDVQSVVLDFDRDRESALDMLPRMFELHRLRHEGSLNAWCQKRNRAFLEEYLRTARRTSMIAFVTLIDGNPIAFEIVVRSGPRVVLYIPAFHPAFSAFRLGHINLHLMMERCAAEGIRIIDFSKGASQAKRHWATGESRNDRYYVALHASLRNWVVMTGALLLLRAKVWGREKGLNGYARVQMGKAKRAVIAWWRREDGGTGDEVSHPGKWECFRYRDIAGLPLKCQESILHYVHRHIARAPVQFLLQPDEVILRSTDVPEEETRIVIPRQHGSAPVLSAVTGEAD